MVNRRDLLIGGAVAIAGAGSVWSGVRQMGRIAELVASGTTTQIADLVFMRELKLWMRFNPRHALTSGDGHFGVTSGNPAMPDWLGPMNLDWAYTAKYENKKNAARIMSSTGLVVLMGT